MTAEKGTRDSNHRLSPQQPEIHLPMFYFCFFLVFAFLPDQIGMFSSSRHLDNVFETMYQ
jgi:hypothetical protein